MDPEPAHHPQLDAPVGVVVGVFGHAHGVGQGDDPQDEGEIPGQAGGGQGVQALPLAEEGGEGQGPQGELGQLEKFRRVPHGVLVADAEAVCHVQQPEAQQHPAQDIVGALFFRQEEAAEGHRRQHGHAQGGGEGGGARLLHKIGEHVQQGLDQQQGCHPLPYVGREVCTKPRFHRSFLCQGRVFVSESNQLGIL